MKQNKIGNNGLKKNSKRDLLMIMYEHVEYSSYTVRTACDIQVVGTHGAWRHKMAWKKLTENDCYKWNSWQSTHMKGTPGDQV